MELKVNGKRKTIDDGASVATLLEALDVGDEATGVAVALNDAVVPRSEWSKKRLEDGDSIEIIRAVQGG